MDVLFIISTLPRCLVCVKRIWEMFPLLAYKQISCHVRQMDWHSCAGQLSCLLSGSLRSCSCVSHKGRNLQNLFTFPLLMFDFWMSVLFVSVVTYNVSEWKLKTRSKTDVLSGIQKNVEAQTCAHEPLLFRFVEDEREEEWGLGVRCFWAENRQRITANTVPHAWE